MNEVLKLLHEMFDLEKGRNSIIANNNNKIDIDGFGNKLCNSTNFMMLFLPALKDSVHFSSIKIKSVMGIVNWILDELNITYRALHLLKVVSVKIILP